MSEIEVGEYVRTEEGYIGILIEYIPNALNYLKIDVGKEIRRDNGMSDNYIYTRYGFQLKHSKQQIELIEDKDIVEIELSEEFVEKKDKKKLIQIGDVYTKETLQRDIDNGIITRILTILSYNQYMANCYKVGGEE